MSIAGQPEPPTPPAPDLCNAAPEPRPAAGAGMWFVLGHLPLLTLFRSVTYQGQVLSTGFNALRPAEEDQVRQLFEQGRLLLWRRVFDQLQATK
jgi:hypothetical protein